MKRRQVDASVPVRQKRQIRRESLGQRRVNDESGLRGAIRDPCLEFNNHGPMGVR